MGSVLERFYDVNILLESDVDNVSRTELMVS